MNFKHIIVAILGLVLVFMLSYAGISFVLGNIHSSSWGRDERFTVVFFCVIYLCFAPAIAHLINQKKPH